MRRFWFAILWPTVLMAQTRAQGAAPVCTSPSCTSPSCNAPCTPSNPQPNSANDEGAFAAPPRTGTAVGASRSVGIEGFGLHIPATTLRMPTLQLPGLVCFRREPRMLIDAAEAAFTREVTRNLAVPNSAPDSNPVPNAATDVNNCIAPTCAPPTPPVVPAPGTTRLVPIDPTIVGGQSPTPPAPKAVRAISHPDVGMAHPMNGQYMQDPTTGQIYQVVVQPAQVQLQPITMPTAPSAVYVVPSVVDANAGYVPYPNTQFGVHSQIAHEPNLRPLPDVVPVAMNEMISPTASVQADYARREVDLVATLQATQQQAAQLEGELRRLETMVGHLAQNQAQSQAAATPASAQPNNLPLHSISGAVELDGQTSDAIGPLMRLFTRQ